MGKCAILIDAAYLRKVLEHEFGGVPIDFDKLGHELAGSMERLRTYYYDCMPFQSDPPTPEEKRRYSGMDKFIFTIKKYPRFQVCLGKLQKIGESFKQKRVDILMAVDLVRMSTQRQIDKGVLVTGDSDLVPAIEVARNSGVVIEVYYSENSCHGELLQACDERTCITQDLIDRVRFAARAAQPMP